MAQKRLNIGNDNVKGLSAAEYQAFLIKKPKQLRLRNKPVTINGKYFQSTKEGRVYQDLLLQKQAGLIHDFETQKRFPLIEACKGKERSYKAKSYDADFVIYDKDGNIVSVIDVKPDKKKGEKNQLSRTAKYAMSIHLFYLKYGIEVIEK